MYVVTDLQKVERNRIVRYSPESLEPRAFQELNALNTALYVTVTQDGVSTALHYSRLITDRTLGQATTWEAFAAQITDAILMGYGIDLPGYKAGGSYPDKQIVMWDVMSTLYTFTLGYSDYLSGVTNLYPFRWKLPDLAIDLWEGVETYPKLSHSIPVVNGIMCRPYYDEQINRLYAVDGAKLCWQINSRFTPEVQLLDFSELGEVSAHGIYLHPKRATDFQLSFTDRITHLNPYSEWKLTCNAYSFKEYTPIVVLAGMPIWPDEYTLASEHIIQFELSHFPWNKALARRQFLTAEANSQAAVHYQTLSLENYVAKHMDTTAFARESFVILVHTPNLYVIREYLDSWANRILVNHYHQNGLLVHKPTGNILNYHTSRYTDRTELCLQNEIELRAIDADFTGSQVAYEAPICYHTSSGYPLDLQTNALEMIYVCG